MRFLRNDIACKEISLNLARTAGRVIHTQRNKLPLIILGLLAQRIDDCPHHSELGVRLSRTAGHALLELTSLTIPQLPQGPSVLSPRELVPDMARHCWRVAAASRSATPARADLNGPCSILYPPLRLLQT